MYTVSLPPIGEGIQEGEIVRWTVKPGDSVKKDDELVEVMTDKITVKIPSPDTAVAGWVVAFASMGCFIYASISSFVILPSEEAALTFKRSTFFDLAYALTAGVALTEGIFSSVVTDTS